MINFMNTMHNQPNAVPTTFESKKTGITLENSAGFINYFIDKTHKKLTINSQ